MILDYILYSNKYELCVFIEPRESIDRQLIISVDERNVTQRKTRSLWITPVVFEQIFSSLCQKINDLLLYLTIRFEMKIISHKNSTLLRFDTTKNVSYFWFLCYKWQSNLHYSIYNILQNIPDLLPEFSSDWNIIIMY